MLLNIFLRMAVFERNEGRAGVGFAKAQSRYKRASRRMHNAKFIIGDWAGCEHFWGGVKDA